MKYKNPTFVNILLIYSHYKPGKPFLKGGSFFLATPCMLTKRSRLHGADSCGHDIKFGQFLVLFTLTTFSMISCC